MGAGAWKVMRLYVNGGGGGGGEGRGGESGGTGFWGGGGGKAGEGVSHPGQAHTPSLTHGVDAGSGLHIAKLRPMRRKQPSREDLQHRVSQHDT